MDTVDEPSMACHQISEAEPAVQEEARVIGYFDLENSGLQLVEGENTFYLPPEALREHVLMSEEGKEGQNIIVVLGSEADVVQALARNSEELLGDQTTFTVNQLESAISATLPQQFAGVEAVTTTEGQQLLILSEDTTEKMANLEDTEGSATVLQTQLLYQASPKANLSEECATAGTSIQAELQPGFEHSPEVNGKKGTNVIPEESHIQTGPVHHSQENSELQGGRKSGPPAVSPLGVREVPDGGDSFRISISLAQCGSLGQRKIVVSPGAVRAERTEGKQNGAVGGGSVRVKDKHSSLKSVSKAREPAIGIESTSKIPLASSAVHERLDAANMLLADKLAKEKEKAESSVHKNVSSIEAEDAAHAFPEHVGEGMKTIASVRAPQNTIEHVAADSYVPKSKRDEQVVEDAIAGSEKAAGKCSSGELFKGLGDSESVASKPLPASESKRHVQDRSGVTSVVQENFAESGGLGATTLTATKAATYTHNERELSAHRENALNRGAVGSSTDDHQQCSFPDRGTGFVSTLKQNKVEEEACVPPAKHNSRTPARVHTDTEQISFTAVTTAPESNVEGKEQHKESVIKSTTTQNELCQAIHGIDARVFEKPNGEDTPAVKDLPLQKLEEIAEADSSKGRAKKSREVSKAREQSAYVAKSDVEDQVALQLPKEKAPATPSDTKIANEQDLAASRLLASKSESSASSNSLQVSYDTALGNSQEGSKNADVENASKSKLALAEEQNATHSLGSLNLESNERSVCDSLGSRAHKLKKQAPKFCDSRREHQKPDAGLEDTHGEPVDNSVPSNSELQSKQEDNRIDDTDKDSQNGPALSPEANEPEAREEVRAGSSDEKLLAALDLVPCQESSSSRSSVALNSSPPPEMLDGAFEMPGSSSSLLPVHSSPPPEKLQAAERPGPSSAVSGSVGTKKRKREKNEGPSGKPGPSSQTYDAAAKKGEEEGSSPGKKRWSLRSPTKPRKRFIIPDSDDEDFDSYGNDDIDTLQSKSEEAFDVLLNVFKTEQAKKAASHAEPTAKKNTKKGGPSSPKRKPSFSKSHGRGDAAAKKEEATSKAEKPKAKEKLTRKGCLVLTPSHVDNRAPATKRAVKRRSEHAKPAACKKSADGDTATQTPAIGNRIPSVSELFAGDIRIRCQKPSSNDKAPTNYHCSKCGFRSTRMENIVRHHKLDCPYTKKPPVCYADPSKRANAAPT